MSEPNPLPPPGAALPHYVSDAPFDPSREPAGPAFGLGNASQLRLIWIKFRRHRVALISGIFLLLMYGSLLITEFLAPYRLDTRNLDFIHAPPQRVHLFHDGQFIGPFVYGQTMRLDMAELRRVYTDDPTDPQKLRFFCRGEPYLFWKLIPADRHLVCPAEGGRFNLLGTDRLGRDVFSRILHGARISLTIGLLGTLVSFTLGIVIGGIAGYRGGWFDHGMQRMVEVIQSIPSIPLWMTLAAIIPLSWSPLLVYLGITLILGMLDWTGQARAVRSKLFALREEDYVLAAELMGARSPRIISRHLIPGVMSHLIASASLSVPGMILGETALTFLGLGLRPPVTSWGILLTEARGINIVALYPWLLWPMVPVVLVILAFNFLGDGLRDAADPYR
ncbi:MULTISPECIES: ABC transporter permease [Paracoccus]|uniref:ABC transporter permease subunit n=1 Tax=Paracoccus litorisediminis TaxID=2006130 RepID=A0A844HM36_9RHOB|nr:MULTISPECIES: ABC transporter permease [Paracoccus]MBD9527190.1 ABC transporter permease [Paracoccus sp. PAR01]MTH59437.1 ABC transporter permease subunit [Paracoccus litorisediminis]